MVKYFFNKCFKKGKNFYNFSDLLSERKDCKYNKYNK